MSTFVQTHRKYLVALLALLTTVVNVSLVHGTALRWVQVAIAVLAAEGVRAVSNTPPPAGD